MILIHGNADRTVPVEQTRAWAEKMQQLGMTYEYREIRGGDHGRTLTVGAPHMVAFFSKHTKRAE